MLKIIIFKILNFLNIKLNYLGSTETDENSEF